MTMLTSEQALEELKRLESSSAELLGIDGLLVHGDGGVEGPLDLIFDFTVASVQPGSVNRFEEARQFVIANVAPNVRWEIVTA